MTKAVLSHKMTKVMEESDMGWKNVSLKIGLNQWEQKKIKVEGKGHSRYL